MKIELDKRFKKNAKGRFENYTFEVGILKDGPHKKPFSRNGFNVFQRYAGGPVRKAGRESDGTLSNISKFIRDDMRTNYLRAPFQGAGKSKEIIKFAEGYFKLVAGRVNQKQVENLLQAVVRNPFLRGDYGNNSRQRIFEKGFDRFGIDTGQFFKAIKASAKKVRRLW